MQIPVMRGVIDRRILVNYRLDPEAAARVLPTPFRPKLVRGHAMAGVCLIRLVGVRPAALPIPWGVRSENAAHRFAVEWDHAGQAREGVYIPRRDTDSRINAWVGGRLFPGVHHHAAFEAEENETSLRVAMRSDDGTAAIAVEAHRTDVFPESSVFESLDEASSFFEHGSLGYSSTADAELYDGLELRCKSWEATALDVDHVSSSFFDDLEFFPLRTAEFDHALLMQNISHEWHGREALCCSSQTD